MVRSADERSAFRCTVPPEHSAAKLKIGRVYHDVNVTEMSRNSFTVCMPQATYELMGMEENFRLRFEGESWNVAKQSAYTFPNNGMPITKVGFMRIKDLTTMKEPRASIFHLFSSKTHGHSDPTFLMYLMLAFIFACLALPGMGDNLGTAPKIREGIHEIIKMIQSFL